MTLRRHCALCDDLIASGGLCEACETESKLASAEWYAARQYVIDRDVVCLLRLDDRCSGVAETADHIVPRSAGGSNDVSNLQGSCEHCNRKKGFGSEVVPTA